MWLAKAWTAIDRLSVLWKSNLSDKIKRNFFQSSVVSILLYGCTTWTQTKCLEKKLDGTCTRMLWVILNKSWKQHPTKQQLYGHHPPISKTIQTRRTRYAGHCWGSKNELISDVPLWNHSHGCASVGQLTRTYLQQLSTDTGCRQEHLPEPMDNRNERLKRELGKWCVVKIYINISRYIIYFSVRLVYVFTITQVVIYKALCFGVAQGRMNGAPNENRTHSCRFASLAC